MKYSMYVIRHDDLKAAMGNDGWGSKNPLVGAYLNCSLGADEYSPDMFEHYSHVANIEANNLEHAFAISNGIVEGNIERLDKCPSLSVGHILIDEDDVKHMVDSFGFSEIG